MSTAACMLASDERLPSVKPCSSWSRIDSSSKLRVTLSSIITKPPMPAAPSAEASPVCTGAICTRSNWPAGVAVTNCVDGLAAPRAMRLRMFSSAWATRLRSNTP